jgi:2'-5' RNA ligase
MHGVASLLDEASDAFVRELWTELDREFGVRAVTEIVPYAHISYHLAEDYDLERTEAVLHTLVRDATPLHVLAAGLGIFTGPQPVLYLAIVRDPALTTFHQRVWPALETVSTRPSPLYTPEQWVPHTTLAQWDITPDTLPALVRHLAGRALQRELVLQNLTLLYGSENHYEPRFTTPFGA